MNSEPAEDKNRGMMAHQELVLPPTSARKQPLSYKADAEEALERAKEAYAGFLVSRLVAIYNDTNREDSFESWLVHTAKTLGVLSQGDSYKDYELRHPDLNGFGIDGDFVGIYIKRRLVQLARIWRTPELADLNIEPDGFAKPLRFARPF